MREQQEQVHRLNRFMAAVLGSMDSGVVAVDRELTVLPGTPRRRTSGASVPTRPRVAHLFSLDIGLPLERLRLALKRQLFSDSTSRRCCRCRRWTGAGEPSTYG